LAALVRSQPTELEMAPNPFIQPGLYITHTFLKHSILNYLALLHICTPVISVVTFHSMLLYMMFLLLFPPALGCNLNPELGIWMVRDCDTLWKAADALGVNTTDIQHLNPTETVDWYVTSGQEYIVPYKARVTPPATWATTESCTPKLLLHNTPCGQREKNGNFSSDMFTPCKRERKTITTCPTATSGITATVSKLESLGSNSIAYVLSTVSPSAVCYAESDQIAKSKPVVQVFSQWACKTLIEKMPIFQSRNDSVAVVFASSSLNHYFSVRWSEGLLDPKRISPNCSEVMLDNWERCEYQINRTSLSREPLVNF
jgi:hypothetical protein